MAAPPACGQWARGVASRHGHLDASGRFYARALLQALERAPGQRIDLAVVADAVVIGSSATGRQAVGVRGEVAVPAPTRSLLGLESDHRVILAAAPELGVLVVHPHATIAQLLTEHYRRQTAAVGRVVFATRSVT
ncbi:hypothetical protein [Couchioplanes caeruleus]|uniref:hypothetical protein n=1 Tax=Couchioplanes caeruleus TaxID=56438 RepID=UPI000AEC778A|nr:hypothetical protein [Couchioplanes caeruleus]